MKKYLLALGLTGSLFLAGPALAGDSEEEVFHFRSHGHFENLDKNEDGKLSQDEFLSRHQDRFAKMDENQDGFIDEEERDAFREKIINRHKQRFSEMKEERWEHLLSRFDDNDDMVLELEEIMEEVDEKVSEAMERVEKRRIEMVTRLDIDDDSFLTEKEFLGGGPMSGFRFGPDRILEKLDSDDNGEISREEFAEGRDRIFDRLDKNEDGVLDKEELSRRGRFAILRSHSEEDQEEE